MGGRLLGIVVGALVAFLPERYRGWWQLPSSTDFRIGAFVSGMAQVVGLLLVLVLRYLSFFQERVRELAGEAMQRGAEGALASTYVQTGMGSVVTLEYLFHPLTLLLLYFIFEGGVRAFAPFLHDEVLGTLPLYLIALAHAKIATAQAERALGPRLVDTVERGDGKEFDLRISSCRPKPTWDRLMTVAYDGEYYEVAAEQPGRPPRPTVYLLRKNPPWKVIRGVHHYRPDEVLTP